MGGCISPPPLSSKDGAGSGEYKTLISFLESCILVGPNTGIQDPHNLQINTFQLENMVPRKLRRKDGETTETYSSRKKREWGTLFFVENF